MYLASIVLSLIFFAVHGDLGVGVRIYSFWTALSIWFSFTAMLLIGNENYWNIFQNKWHEEKHFCFTPVNLTFKWLYKYMPPVKEDSVYILASSKSLFVLLKIKLSYTYN